MFCFLQDKPEKVWRSFCCSVFGQKEGMSEQKPRATLCSQCKLIVTPQVATSLGWQNWEQSWAIGKDFYAELNNNNSVYAALAGVGGGRRRLDYRATPF